MSAVECHEKENLPLIAEVYSKRLEVIAQMPDEQLGSAKDAADFRANRPKHAAYIASLKTFAMINHPLPR
jgi:hypothetical protein